MIFVFKTSVALECEIKKIALGLSNIKILKWNLICMIVQSSEN